MRSLSSQWIFTKLVSSPTFSYSTRSSVSIPLQLSLGSSSIALFPFSKHVSSPKAKFSLVSRPYAVSLLPHVAPKESLSLIPNAFLRLLLTYASPGWFSFLSVTNITKSERLHRAASCSISVCLSTSPIPLLLSEASLLPLRVTLTHFTLSSY